MGSPNGIIASGYGDYVKKASYKDAANYGPWRAKQGPDVDAEGCREIVCEIEIEPFQIAVKNDNNIAPWN